MQRDVALSSVSFSHVTAADNIHLVRVQMEDFVVAVN